MGKSAIKDLFHGRRGHIDAMNLPKNDINQSVVCGIFDELKEKLSPELLSLHQKLMDSLAYNCSEDFYFAEKALVRFAYRH